MQQLVSFKSVFLLNNNLHLHEIKDEKADIEIINSDKYQVYYKDKNSKRIFLNDSRMNLNDYVKLNN